MKVIRIFLVFVILYVFPFYPHYADCIYSSLKRLLSIMFFSVLYGISVRDNIQAVCIPLLCVTVFTDLKYGEIPDAAVLLVFVLGILKMHTDGILPAAVMFFFLLPFAVKEKIGFGDVKLICAWAMLKGQEVFTGCAAASAACLCFLYMKKGSPLKIIPFGPFLSFGFMLTLF